MIFSVFLDDNNDFITDSNGNLKLITSYAEYVNQKIRVELQTFYGECFTDFTKGFKYYEIVFDKQVSLDEKNSAFQTFVLGLDVVKEIVTFETSFDTDLNKYIVRYELIGTESSEIIRGESTL